MSDTAADWKRQCEAWERLARDLDKENDDLRRENEAFRKVLGTSVGAKRAAIPAISSYPVRGPHGACAAPDTERSAEPAPEMCCGGTCVRAVCTFHGPQPQGGAGA